MVIPVVIVMVVITKAVLTSRPSQSKDGDRYKKKTYLLKNKVAIIKWYVQLKSFKNIKYITREMNSDPKLGNHLDILLYLIAI